MFLFNFCKEFYAILKPQLLMIGCRSQILNGSGETTYALPEKTKRGPPTNKYISVRNMKAHITNMSLNENAGFKREYHVRSICNRFITDCVTYL